MSFFPLPYYEARTGNLSYARKIFLGVSHRLAHRLRDYLLPKPFGVSLEVRDTVGNLLEGRWRAVSVGQVYPEEGSDYSDLVVHVLAGAVARCRPNGPGKKQAQNKTDSRLAA